MEVLHVPGAFEIPMAAQRIAVIPGDGAEVLRKAPLGALEHSAGAIGQAVRSDGELVRCGDVRAREAARDDAAHDSPARNRRVRLYL